MAFLYILIDIIVRLHLAFCPLIDSLYKCVIKYLRFDVRNGEIIDCTKEDNTINAVAKCFFCTEWTSIALVQHLFTILKMEKVRN